MSDVSWTPVTVRLSQLTPWERNPKRISKTHAARLLELWKEIGQFQTIAIGPNGEVYDGHQRLSVLKAAHGKSYEVIALQSSQVLTEKQRERLTIEAHTGTTGQFDWDALAGWDAAELQAWGFDAELLQDWNTGAAALATMLEAEGVYDGEKEHTIGRNGRLYEGHEIEPFKLAHRIEAAWRANGGLALDLFSGAGQLASWYRRRFRRVVTVDKAYQVGDVDYSMKAGEFIAKHLSDFMDFDFVDFDDEGMPAKEIQAFFAAIAGKRSDPFVLALTDGCGLNMKMRGYVDFGESYLVECGEKRRATVEDYYAFENTVTSFVVECARRSGFTASQLSSYRGRENNVVFQTWFVTRSDNDAVQPAEAV